MRTYHYSVRIGHGKTTFPTVALGSLRESLAFFWKGRGVQSPWLAISQTYLSALFSVLGLAMETNMKATLCEHTLDNAYLAHPDLRGAIVHSDRGRQYTSETYRQALSKYGIIQSMNSDGGRCHDNARCESMWARMKSELLYDRYNTESLTTDELRVLIWRYFISYWNNRGVLCSANGGLPPMIKRQRYYQSLGLVS